MMRKLPTLKQLRFLICLEEHKNFRKAAEVCSVAQPTFSLAIKKLEASLGVKLANRTNKSVALTDTGKEVVRRARKILVQAEELSDVMSIQKEPLCGSLRLGVIPTIAPFALPKLVKKILRAYPKLSLQIKENVSQSIYHDLINDELDLLLLALPYEMENVDVVNLFNDRFLFACASGTRLLKKPVYVSSDKLPDNSILLLEDGHCLRDHALSVCDVRQSRKISPYTSSSLHTLVQMVDNDLGVTFVPEIAVDSGLLKGTKIEISELPEFAYREIGFAWRKGAVRKDEFLLFAEVFKSLFPKQTKH